MRTWIEDEPCCDCETLGQIEADDGDDVCEVVTVARYRLTDEPESEHGALRLRVNPDAVDIQDIVFDNMPKGDPDGMAERWQAADLEALSRIHCLTAAKRLAWSIGHVLGVSVDVEMTSGGCDVQTHCDSDHILAFDGTGVMCGIVQGLIQSPIISLTRDQLFYIVYDVWMRILEDYDLFVQSIDEYERTK